MTTMRQAIRRALSEHVEIADDVHHGCLCDRRGPDDLDDGEAWWLDHVTNELVAAITHPKQPDPFARPAPPEFSRGLTYPKRWTEPEPEPEKLPVVYQHDRPDGTTEHLIRPDGTCPVCGDRVVDVAAVLKSMKRLNEPEDAA